MAVLELEKEFDQLIGKVKNHLQEDGLRISSGQQEDYRFSAFDSIRQQKILDSLRIMAENLEIIEPNSSEEDRLTKVLEKNEILPVDKELFNRLKGVDCWEIVDFNVNQLYRSKACYQFSSYTLEDFVTRSPFELWKKPESIVKAQSNIIPTLAVESKILEMTHLPSYVMEELESEKKHKILIQHLFVCPLFSKKQNRNVAFLSAFQANRVDNEQNNNLSVFSRHNH